jgi:hypothetical protein
MHAVGMHEPAVPSRGIYSLRALDLAPPTGVRCRQPYACDPHAEITTVRSLDCFADVVRDVGRFTAAAKASPRDGRQFRSTDYGAPEKPWP